MTRQSTLSRNRQGPRAVLNALERLATGYGSECVRGRQDPAIAEVQLRDYQESSTRRLAIRQDILQISARMIAT